MSKAKRAAFVLAAQLAVLLPAAACSPAGASDAGHSSSIRAPQAAGAWGRAKAARGIGAFYNGSRSWDITVTAMSCAAPENCAVVGYYDDVLHHLEQPFVVSEVRGVWGRARNVPGLAALSSRRNAELDAVSCAAPGYCTAGGYVRDSAGHDRALVVNQVRGTWKAATEVPGAAKLAGGTWSAIRVVSCPSPGNCVAGGSYAQGIGRYQVFVVGQVHGAWHSAEPIPGVAARNRGGDATLTSVSCRSAGNCTAIGNYAQKPEGDFTIYNSVFAAREVNGSWRAAVRVPSVRNSGYSVAASAACSTAGECGAGGDYEAGPAGYDGPDDGSAHAPRAFVVTTERGSWGPATTVPGASALGKGGSTAVSALSCSGPRTCGVGGSYYTGGGQGGLFVASLSSGRWTPATKLLGIPALGKVGKAELTAMSCASPGNCSVGGYYRVRPFVDVAFVVNEVRGAWGRAAVIRGVTFSDLAAISCASAGRCGASGSFAGARHASVFVVSSG